MTKDAKALHEVIRLCTILQSAIEYLDRLERGIEKPEGFLKTIESLTSVKDALPDMVIELIKPIKKRHEAIRNYSKGG